jgi:hypothetical protein
MLCKSRKMLFVLVLVGMLTGGAGCSKSASSEDGATDVDTDSDSDSDTDSDTDTDTDSDTDTDTDTDTSTDTWDEWCDEDWEEVYSYTIQPPPPGIPATTSDICAAADDPVESNQAAFLTLNIYSDDPLLVTGQIAIADDLQGEIVGLPEIAIDFASPDDLEAIEITDLVVSGPNFTFNASWPTVESVSYGNITFIVTVEVSCGINQPNKIVESTTYVELCHEETGPWAWVSSGQICYYCENIAEMAPTPVPPDQGDDEIPLARALTARIDRVAAVGRELVLLADHNGAQGRVGYEWRASAGALSDTDQGGVVWTLPDAPGPHLIQLAVRDGGAAAVASFRISGAGMGLSVLCDL